MAAPSSSGLQGRVRAELEAAGRLDSVAGAAAVLIAGRMEGFDTGAGLAALSKELRAVMAEAVEGGATVVDPVDELRSRRDLKRDAR